MYTRHAGAAGKHALSGESDLLADAAAVFFKLAIPAAIDGEE